MKAATLGQVVLGVCLLAAAACSSGSGSGTGDGGGSSSGGGSGSGGSSTGGGSGGGSGASSSSGGGSGSDAGVSCEVTSQNACYVFLNGAPETPGGNGLKCQSELGGKTVSTCPTAGLLGCCVYTSPSDYECFYTGSGAKGCSGGTGVDNWSSTTLPGSSGSSGGGSSSGSSSGSGGGTSSSADGGACIQDPAEIANPCTAPLLGACVYLGNSGDAKLCTETAGDSSLLTSAGNACTSSSFNPGAWYAGMTCKQALSGMAGATVAGGCMTNDNSPSTYCQTDYWGLGTTAPGCFSCSGVCAIQNGAPCVKPE